MVAAREILVPVNQTGASLEAVGVACGMAKQRKARVTVLHVIEVLRSLPLNAEMETEARKGESFLRRAEELANEMGVAVGRSLVQAREAGPAIVDEALDRGVETIVLGLGYKRVVGTFQIGRTTDFVLKNAQSQVWVVRQALQSGVPEEGRERV